MSVKTVSIGCPRNSRDSHCHSPPLIPSDQKIRQFSEEYLERLDKHLLNDYHSPVSSMLEAKEDTSPRPLRREVFEDRPVSFGKPTSTEETTTVFSYDLNFSALEAIKSDIEALKNYRDCGVSSEDFSKEKKVLFEHVFRNLENLSGRLSDGCREILKEVFTDLSELILCEEIHYESINYFMDAYFLVHKELGDEAYGMCFGTDGPYTKSKQLIQSWVDEISPVTLASDEAIAYLHMTIDNIIDNKSEVDALHEGKSLLFLTADERDCIVEATKKLKILVTEARENEGLGEGEG